MAALVRLPGVAWGVNWPDGFTTHHPDEYTHVANADAIITPFGSHADPYYPKAMGAYAAAPYLLFYAAQGRFGGPRVHLPFTVGAGRLISVIFGIASVLLVFAIARDAFDERTGILAAWLLALGGLHVTQSHFFLADVPAVAWTLLAVWLLWRDLTGASADHEAIRWAAFAVGAAFALKLFVFAIPAVVYVVFARRPRFIRAVHAIVFAFAGLMISSLGFETPANLYRAATGGINYPYEFDRLKGAVLHAVQLPALLSLPLLVLGILGSVGLLRQVLRAAATVRWHALIVFGSVPLIAVAFVLFKLDHFPRHWVLVIPWAAIAAGWWLARLTERLQPRATALVFSVVFGWMFAVVVDSERFFIFEPRNDALRWLRANVPEGTTLHWMGRRTPPGYRQVRWLVDGQPDVLIVEMGEANHSLSGVNWRNSYPTNFREVFDGRTPERVAAIQALFRGSSEYVEVARFTDSYVMPEYRVAMSLLGDRARSFITEVVVFRRAAEESPSKTRGGET